MLNAFCALGLYTCGTSVSEEIHSSFLQHMAYYGLSYGTQEEMQFRMELFAKQDAYIKEMNAKNLTFTLGHNKFSTHTEREFQKLLNPLPVDKDHKDFADLPSSSSSWVDWRTKFAVTMARTQGNCGSSWAFSAAAAIESSYKLDGHPLQAMSPQQILDCYNSSTYGCGGGFVEDALQYAQKYPLMTEKDYPYTGMAAPCAYDEEKAHAQVTKVNYVKHDSAKDLVAAVALKPVSVLLSANGVLQSYKEGIIQGDICDTYQNLAAVVVGYNLSPGPDTPPYYIVKNSFGMDWGEMGYARIAIEEGEGVCGIQMNPMFPTTN